MGRRVHLQIRPYRRLVQCLVIAALVAIPLLTASTTAWPPSRIAQGQLPPPTLFPVNGDTWSLSVGALTFTHPLAFLEEVLASRVLLVSFALTALVPLLVALVFGRIFCSYLCPVGCALELVQSRSRRWSWPASRRTFRFRDERLAILVLLLVLSLVLGMPVLANFDPPHVLGRELMTLGTFGTLSLAGSGFLAAILLLDLLVFSRAWCNYLCPSGGGLALLGRWRRLRIRLDKNLCTRCGDCDRVCPYYIEPLRLARDEPFDWQKCDNCGLCRDVCPEGAIRFTMKRSD